MNYQDRLYQQKEKALYRSLSLSDPSLVDLQSNDYLGYARLMEVGKIAAHLTIKGATGSRLISGNNTQHETTEKLLSQYFNAEGALLFSSGYQANIGVLSCIAHRGDVFIYDEYIHASMHDGMRLSHAERHSFRHNDLNDLEEKLKKHSGSGRIIVAVESLYSMTGTVIDIDELLVLNAKYDFTLVLDEAHAVGVSGRDYKGVGYEKAHEFQNLIRIITFGKAFGYAGAAVLATELIREYLINFSRPFIYTTAIPINDAATISQLIDYHSNNHKPNEELDKLIKYYLSQVKSFNSNLTITSNQGPVQFLTIGDAPTTIGLEKNLLFKGLQVKAIRPPTVPAGHAGLRISLHAYNTSEEFDILFKTLNNVS